MPLMCATVPSSHGTHGEVPSSVVLAPFVSVKVPGGQASQAVAFFAIDGGREGDPSGGGLQGTRPRAWQLGGPTSRGLR
eukprot:9027495-Pyramimonas_sp.AAC.1